MNVIPLECLEGMSSNMAHFISADTNILGLVHKRRLRIEVWRNVSGGVEPQSPGGEVVFSPFPAVLSFVINVFSC